MTKAPPLKNDCFALPPGVDWTPVDDALQALNQRLSPRIGVETVSLSDALDRFLATDVVARRAHPPHPNTAVDGYGFAGNLSDGPHALPLVEGRAAAGQAFDGIVPDGHAIRILTGAALPKGVDTVCLQEDVTVADVKILINGPLKQGANTRKAGEDSQEGDTVLTKGHRLRPQDIGLAASVGVAQLDVFQSLRVAVVSTGDEVVDPGQGTGTYDANRPMLLSLIKAWGFQAIDIGIIPDDRSQIEKALNDAAAQADVILTTGGASAGDEDHISAILNERGAMGTWRIAIKPGRPLAMGVWNGVPIFGLPGNPVAAFVCSLIFARPAMLTCAGGNFVEPQGMVLAADFKKNKKLGRREYLRARRVGDRVQVFPSEGSGRISGLTWAEGLVELPDGAMTVEPGTPVKYIPFSEFGI